jgi:hypothetical protein
MLAGALPFAGAAGGRAFEQAVLNLPKTNPNDVKLLTQLGGTRPDLYREFQLIGEIKSSPYIYRTPQILRQLAAKAAQPGSRYLLLAQQGARVSAPLALDAEVGVVDVTAGTITSAAAGESILEAILAMLAF